MLSNNLALPALSILQARSTYAQILLVVIVALNALGFDILSVLSEMGLGATPDEVIASSDKVVAAWQQVAPLVLGIWAWLERRAPSYRLVWPWSAKSAVAVALGTLLFALPPTGSARADDKPIRSDVSPSGCAVTPATRICQLAISGTAGPRV